MPLYTHEYTTRRETYCGCCHRAVHLIETPRSALLVELVERAQPGDGDQIPHRCSGADVARWLLYRRWMAAASKRF